MAVDHKCAAPAAGQQVMALGVGALTIRELRCLSGSSVHTLAVAGSAEFLVFAGPKAGVSGRVRGPAEWAVTFGGLSTRYPSLDSGVWFCDAAGKNCFTRLHYR